MFSQLHVGRSGAPAPPTDRSCPPASSRTAPRLYRSSYLPSKEVAFQSTCSSGALKNRTSPIGPGSDSTAGPNGGNRTARLYELDQEGAYTAKLPASLPAGSGGDNENRSSSGGGSSGVSSLLDEGWGVVPLRPAAATAGAEDRSGTAAAVAAARTAAKREKKKQKQQQQQPSAAAQQPPRQRRGTPYMDKSSEVGLEGLTMLQQSLVVAGRMSHDEAQKARAAAEAAARRQRQIVRRKRDWVDPELLDEGEGEAEEVSQEALLMQEELEGQQRAGQEGQQQQRRQGRRERGVQQYLELNLEADGTTEVVEFDEQGRVKARRQPGMPVLEDDIEAEDDEEDDDPLAFLADLEGDDDEDDDEEDEEPSEDADEVEEEEEEGDSSGRRSAAAGPSGRGVSSSPFPSSSASQKRSLVGRNAGSRRGAEEEEEEEDGGEGLVLMPGVNPLLDEEIEWGLDELGPTGQQRPSLLRELGVIKGRPSDRQQQQQHKRSPASSSSSSQQQQQQAGKQQQQKQTPADGVIDEDEEQGGGGAAGQVGVAWGGSGGASGIDMEQQEALLSRLFKPHKVKELMAHQLAAEAELAALKRRTSGRAGQEARLHTRMRLIGGSAAGKQLVSSAGANTRPMMEKVRHALFNMIQAQAGSGAGLPTTARWLDCFAGTGSVGLEALSRGVRECHFIEMDPWVCRKVLSRNISTCGFTRRSVVHTMKAEDFLRRAIELPKFAGGPFDFLSVCPPYLLVSYPELMDLLHRSPLLHERSIVFVEYPKQLAHQVPPTLGSLVTVRDRKYGRTWIRVYGPASGMGGGEEDGGGEEEERGEEEEAGDELLLI